MKKCTGGEVLAQVLQANGVEHVFSLPGVGIFPIYDACLSAGIKVIGCRNEAAAVYGAEGWSRITGRTGVALIPEGPGHANAIPAVATAFAESSPVLVLSGIDASRNLGRGALHELPQVGMCGPVTKWSALLSDTLRIPEYIHAAFRIARTGVAGPVHISLTADALEQHVDPSAILDLTATAQPPEITDPDPEAVREAVELLARADRPLIVAGIMAYWSDAGESLRRLVDTTRIPVFTVERARGLVSDDLDLCFGDGYTSMNPAAHLMPHADAVLLLGDRVDCRFAYGHSFGRAKLIHVWPDAADIGKNRNADVGLACDTGRAAAQLLAAAETRDWPEKTPWIEMLRRAREERDAETNALAECTDAPPHPVRIAREVESFLDEKSIVVFDGGDFAGWTRLGLKARRPGAWQTGTVLGQLGVGLPYALGAKLAAPEARVVLLTGDGALGFSMMELETAVRQRLPVVVVVGNDAAWGIEKHFQTSWFGADRLVGTQLSDVRWDRMAEAMGAHGEYVETPEDLAPALRRAFDAGIPACVNVRMDSIPSPMARAFSRLFVRRREQTRKARQRG